MDSTEHSNQPVAKVVRRNIQDILAARKKIERKQTRSERLAGVITKAAGSMWFSYLHVAWFAAWIAWNVARGDDAYDPFPFGMLTTIVSLEAIFLTLMVLVSQNREAHLEEQRSDLDLQIDLLSEHELTKMLCIVVAIAQKVGVDPSKYEDAEELEREVRPRDMLKELEN
jgi:uncharacterized membrane protein